jgi:hypothetical protein
MVDVDLPESLTPAFIKLIPHQRRFVSRMMKQGVIANYSLSYDRKKLWVIVHADTLFEVKNVMGSFPIFNHIKFTIHNLLFHESSHLTSPQLWLN